ncbi:YD repeat-containing protein [Asticcacaulis biprosthecium C19]|uniref:YD repeat-containing protein n=1 Tax=Asticcacaulis biprosthecium C19 TaxID=715226 RepID=F4QHW4_9CAUL|nr:hypothetical protein [Asticcacaulis biprosthecium]EGF92851.1 YD repeat-containing protein [Asticcacaulis biprosthecium C19]
MSVATRSAKLLLGVSVAAILAAAFGGAQAQVASLPPPVASATDRNGVDLMSGTLSVPLPGISAGSNGSGISRVGSGYNLPYGDNFVGVINGASVTSAITVSLGGTSEQFNYLTFNSGTQLYTYGSDTGTGNSLTCTTNTLNLCYYIGSDGTKATFDRTQTGNYAIQASLGAVSKIEKPDGEELNFYYRSYIANASPLVKFLQVHSVTSSLGWMVKYELSDSASWIVPTKIYIVNTSTDHCDPTTYGTGGSDSCTVGTSWPTLNGSGGGGGGLVLDAAGTAATTTVTTSTVNGRALVTGITTPTGVSMSATLTGDKVTALTTSGQTWNYAYSDNSGIRTTTVSNPAGGTRVLVSNTSLSQVISDRDEEGRVTKYEYQNKRIYRVINPDATYSGATLTGGYTEYEYDARGNVTKTTVVPKDAIAGTTKNLVATAAYPASCPATDLKFCNQPTSVTDYNGLTTTYEYDTPVGGTPIPAAIW